jgi:hypothetical protein
MTPLFKTGDLLFVRPLALSDVYPGDVVVFRQSGKDGLVVHRVLSRATAGLMTRGDASIDNDPAPVSAEAMIGRVEALERAGKHHRVPGRWAGRLLGWAVRGRQRAFRVARRLLGFPYHALRGSEVARHFLVRVFATRFEYVSFQTPQGTLVKVTHRGKVVARWWPHHSRFECQKPYDLVIPRPGEWENTPQPDSST